MPQLVTMTFPNLNVSVQPTDLVYYVPITPVGTPGNLGYSASTTIFDTGSRSNIVQIGFILSVDRANNSIDVVWDDSDNDGDGLPDIPLPDKEDFILFSKSKPNNTSSLVGYYASVNFVNNSNKKVELFSVGSEVSLSSK